MKKRVGAYNRGKPQKRRKECSMYELKKVGENSFYIDCPAKIGVVRKGGTSIHTCGIGASGDVWLIDSGSDKDAAKKVKQAIEPMNWKVQAIYNTHSHADHIGGNKYFQDQTGCKIYAPGLERSFTEAPILEPMYLYGAMPMKELQNKFLCAKESVAEPLTKEALPDGWEMIPLPGHSFDMVGFRTPDNVVYLADALSSAEVLEKYKVGFLCDVGAYLETLERVKTMEAAMFVPSHAEATENITPLAELNIKTTLAVAEKIESFCASTKTFEEIVKATFDSYGLTMSLQQYVLLGSTIKAYLTWLRSQGRVDFEFTDNKMIWRKA